MKAEAGNLDQAMALLEESLSVNEQSNNLQGQSATLGAIAFVHLEKGDTDAALEDYTKSLDLIRQIGDPNGESAVLHEMARVRRRQGNANAAIDLLHQSLQITENIGDKHGAALTIGELASAAHESGDRTAAIEYSTRATDALAQVQAWPDLIRALRNRGAYDDERSTHWLAQAAWLALVLHASTPRALLAVQSLFHAIPAGHPLELPLALLAATMFTRHGPVELQDKNRDEAVKLLNITAHNLSLSEEAANALLKEKLKDPGKLYRETLQAIQALVPDPWIFDRPTVLASLASGMSSSNQEAAAE